MEFAALLELAAAVEFRELAALAELSMPTELAELSIPADLPVLEEFGICTEVAELIVNTRKGSAAALAELSEFAEPPEVLGGGIGNSRIVELLFV